MWNLALSFTQHDTDRMQQAAAVLLAAGGVLNFFGSGVPLGRRTGQALGGVAIAAAGILWFLALRYGTA
jgi:hypothetical protein